MKLFRDAFRLLRVNAVSLVCFEAIYKLLVYTVLLPGLLFVFKISQRAAGLRYLTGENFSRYLHHPSTWLLAALQLFLFILVTAFDVAAVISCYDASRQGKTISPWAIFRAGFQMLGGLLHRRIYPLVFVLISIPMTSITLISGYLTTAQLPTVLISYLQRHPAFFRWYLLIFLLTGILLFFLIYSLHYYLLDRVSMRKACRSSFALLRGRHLRTLAMLACWTAIWFLLYFILIFLLALILTLLTRLLSDARFAFVISMRIVSVLHTALTLLFSAFLMPLFFSFLSAGFYRAKDAIGEPILPVQLPLAKKSFRHPRVLTLLLAAVLLTVNVFYLSLYASGSIDLTSDLTAPTSVTAHRGYSAAYPENTLEAFSAAIEAGSDWIELDIQQTKDGQLVVLHDSNLVRTTGLRANIWEVTYDELSTLDCGSWFSRDYAGCTIPTLAEALELCRDKVQLNIELKPTGHEVNFVPSVVDLLTEYDMLDQCVLSSMKYDIVQQIKAYNPEIKTVYVMSVAYGSIARLSDADAYSIQAAFVSKSLVNSIHESGKKVYAWTVNRASYMDHLLDLGVDNIITDEPVLAQEVIASTRHSGLLSSYIFRLLARS